MERRVIEPVCQCSSTRPVESTIGYSLSGTSSGAITCAGTILPRPLAVGKPVVKMISYAVFCLKKKKKINTLFLTRRGPLPLSHQPLPVYFLPRRRPLRHRGGQVRRPVIARLERHAPGDF